MGIWGVEYGFWGSSAFGTRQTQTWLCGSITVSLESSIKQHPPNGRSVPWLAGLLTVCVNCVQG